MGHGSGVFLSRTIPSDCPAHHITRQAASQGALKLPDLTTKTPAEIPQLKTDEQREGDHQNDPGAAIKTNSGGCALGLPRRGGCLLLKAALELSEPIVHAHRAARKPALWPGSAARSHSPTAPARAGSLLGRQLEQRPDQTHRCHGARPLAEETVHTSLLNRIAPELLAAAMALMAVGRSWRSAAGTNG